jgi:hypothetical protein
MDNEAKALLINSNLNEKNAFDKQFLNSFLPTHNMNGSL